MRPDAAAAILANLAALVPAAPGQAADKPLAFDHFMVAISVADIDAETAFYVDKLGFAVEKDASMRDGAVKMRWLVNGTERIELIQSAGSAPGPARAQPPAHAGIRGLTQITLATSDLESVRAALAARNVIPALDITEVEPLGIKVMYVTDPEGNAVEIVQWLPGQGPPDQPQPSQEPTVGGG